MSGSSDREAKAALKTLSAMPGQGSSDDWIEAMGEACLDVLRRHDDPRALASQWLAAEKWRPMPRELADLAQVGQPRGDAAVPTGCPDCAHGWREARTLRRLPGGMVRVRVAMCWCTCSMGRLKGATRERLGADDAQMQLRRERMVTRASGEPGLLAWAMTDRAWKAWPAELRRDWGGVPVDEGKVWGEAQQVEDDEGRWAP